MGFLRNLSSPKIQQGIDHGLPVFDRRLQLPAPLIAGADDLAQGHNLTGQVGRDRATKEAILVEDPDLGHVPRGHSES